MSMNLGEQTGRTGQPRRTGQVGRTGPACAKASAAALRALVDKSARQAGRSGRPGLVWQRELLRGGMRSNG